MAIHRSDGCWRLWPTVWVTRRRMISDQAMQARRQWLREHGLYAAEFPARRAALEALAYTAARCPAPPQG